MRGHRGWGGPSPGAQRASRRAWAAQLGGAAGVGGGLLQFAGADLGEDGVVVEVHEGSWVDG
jgi:hypothetical protein